MGLTVVPFSFFEPCNSIRTEAEAHLSSQGAEPMRKMVTGAEYGNAAEGLWLDLDVLADVEVSSEAPGYPVENALLPGSAIPWKAVAPGQSRINLRFDAPQTIGRVRLLCVEEAHERSQEWALHAGFSDGTEREVLRQGWNFSPNGSTTQDETYTLNLRGVAFLRLTIDPDRGRDRYPATLAAWRIAGA